MPFSYCLAQTDSALQQLQNLPKKYIATIGKKADIYSRRISTKTEKTLTKLSRWENKIKGLLQKASPEIAERLFGNNQLTFTSLLQQLKQGENILLQYQAPYIKYTDDVTTSLKYMAQQKEYLDSGIIKKVLTTKTKMELLATEEDKAEAIQQFIKERKKQLTSQVFQAIGQCKYLTKIDHESWYFAETLKNYRGLFANKKKAEHAAAMLLNTIPAFRQFIQKNSQLASLFHLPQQYNTAQGIDGLQTRNAVQGLLQQQMSAGGPNAREMIQQNLSKASTELNKLKDKINKLGGNGNNNDMPDFKPRDLKSKIFWQRLQYGTNVQFAKSTNLYPSTANIGLSIGYKATENCIFGFGIGYKLGMGSITKIAFTHQGINFRGFTDYKVKKSVYLSGGFEMNHNTPFKNLSVLKFYDTWQQSALAGLSKKYKVSKKVNGELKLLYDFLASRQPGVSQPVVFRMGYNF